MTMSDDIGIPNILWESVMPRALSKLARSSERSNYSFFLFPKLPSRPRSLFKTCTPTPSSQKFWNPLGRKLKQHEANFIPA